MNLSERIRKAIELSGKSQAEISREMGVSQSAITQWLTGQTKTLKIGTALALQKATGARAEWINSEIGPMLLTNEQRLLDGMPTPVLLTTWKLAASWAADKELDQPAQYNSEDWVPCPVRHSDYAYALKVRGSSMFNPTGPTSFSEDDLIFVEPLRELKHGSFVIARIDDEEEAVFRQHIMEGPHQYLQALNPAWPDRIIDIRSRIFTVAGIVVARATIFD